jgi:hypothetical protein
MSTRLSASATLRATLVSLLALGVLVLLVLLDPAGEREDAAGPVVPDGFRVLAADEVYDAVLAAQREAGSWRMSQETRSGDRPGSPTTSEVVWDGREVASHLTVLDARRLEATYVGGRLYVRGLATERPWWQVTLADDDLLGGAIASLLTLADPELQAAAWRDPDRFEVVGVEEVGSTPTLRYRVGLPAERYFATLGVPDRVLSQLGDADRFVFDLWLDAEDQTVRVRTTSSVSGSETVTDSTYSDYGADLDVTAPPAAQVTTTPPAPSR